MPGPSRWLIRLSFLYLVTGLLVGAGMLVHKALPLHPAVWALLPVHVELLIFGWIIQLTLGTAYWILPRFLTGKPRGDTHSAWLVVILLNVGIWLTIGDRLDLSRLPLAVAGRVLETGAVLLFIRLHWNRVTTYRDHDS